MKRKQFLIKLIEESKLNLKLDLESLTYDDLFKIALTIKENRLNILTRAIFKAQEENRK